VGAAAIFGYKPSSERSAPVPVCSKARAAKSYHATTGAEKCEEAFHVPPIHPSITK